jgi:PncC family amidohydrolase
MTEKFFEETVIQEIRDLLLNSQQSIAVGESVSSGLLQLAFSAMPDAIQFYQGGITAYNLTQKIKFFSVEPLHAATVNCVSQEVANEISFAVCREFASDWGIGITGYASAVPESNYRVFAFFSVCYRDKIVDSGQLKSRKAEPFRVQLDYANQVLENLLGCLIRSNGKQVLSKTTGK